MKLCQLPTTKPSVVVAACIYPSPQPTIPKDNASVSTGDTSGDADKNPVLSHRAFFRLRDSNYTRIVGKTRFSLGR